MRALAVTSAARSAIAPDMPTIAESGLPEFEVSNWYAIVAPAKTPAAIINRLNAEIVKALAGNDVKKRFLDLAADPLGSTPEELASYQKSEIAKWAKAIKDASDKLEQEAAQHIEILKAAAHDEAKAIVAVHMRSLAAA